MKNLDELREEELKSEPILLRCLRNLLFLLKKHLPIWVGILGGTYLLLNVVFGYLDTKLWLRYAGKENIEKIHKEEYQKHKIGKFFDEITKPGRELAYYFHSDKE